MASILLLALVGACSRDELCDADDRAVDDVDITQGIAGVGLDDVVCMPIAVCSCTPVDITFDLYFAGPEIPADDVAAGAIIDAGTPITVSTGLDGYEQALEAGHWLACTPSVIADAIDPVRCQLVTVDVDAVTSVHPAAAGGDPAFRVFDAAGALVRPRAYEPRPALPRVAYDADCQPLTAPSLCEWATSGDALVTATITRVAPFSSPAEKAVSSTEWILIGEDACEEVVNPGLLLTVDVNVELRGEVPSTIEVRLGADHAHLFETRGALAIGEPIGLLLHHIDDDSDGGIWSLMGERLFTFVDNELRFQQGAEDCFSPPPVDVEGRAVDQLVDAVEACTEASVGDARRTLITNTWGPGASPSAYMAGQCTDPIPLP